MGFHHPFYLGVTFAQSWFHDELLILSMLANLSNDDDCRIVDGLFIGVIHFSKSPQIVQLPKRKFTPVSGVFLQNTSFSIEKWPVGY